MFQIWRQTSHLSFHAWFWSSFKRKKNENKAKQLSNWYIDLKKNKIRISFKAMMVVVVVAISLLRVVVNELLLQAVTTVYILIRRPTLIFFITIVS